MGNLELSGFHVVSVISNPINYQSRYKLYDQFSEDIERKGATLWTVELQTGARTHVVTKADNPHHIQLWHSGVRGIVWHKENLQNIAVQALSVRYPDWRYVCFVDADIKFEAGWAERVAQTLQLHPVVQPWSHSMDFAPDGSAIGTKMQLSYAYCHVEGVDWPGANQYTKGGHPGYAIAFRREAFNDMGGLIDIGLLGSGDRHMMTAMVGKVEDSYHPGVSPGYKKYLHQWQDRAWEHLKYNLGYVPALVRHMFHGSKKHRRYGERWKVLVDYQFDPFTDVKKDSSGVFQPVVTNSRQAKLRDAMYAYFRGRLEDSNSL